MSLVAKLAPGSGAVTPQTEPPSKHPKKKCRQKDEHLSEEDLALKQLLEFYVERIQNPDPELQKSALQSMGQGIRPSASSMTSVPKPLKFLRPHYGTLKAFYETVPDSDFKKDLADVLSVLALTMSAEGERESLKYRLLGSGGDVGSWGHEYVRNLAGEIAQEYMNAEIEDFPFDDIMELVQQIVAILMKHNAEPEAVDLLMEVSSLKHMIYNQLQFEDLELLSGHVDNINFRRTCLYLTSAARYLAEPDDILPLDIAYATYLKFQEFANAFQIALFLGDTQVFFCCVPIFIPCGIPEKLLSQDVSGFDFELDDEICRNDDDRIHLQDIINNAKLSESYLTLARDMEVLEPKYLEDFHKVWTSIAWSCQACAGSSVDLAATFVNAFVHAGFHQDMLMTVPADSSSGGSSGNWVFKNKEHGKTSAVASLGVILLWDVDFGLAQIDKYIHSNDNYVIAGALLGVGLVSCNVFSCLDPARGILREYIGNGDSSIQIGAIMGLGIAYAGAKKEQLRKRLTHVLNDGEAPLDVIAFTAISLGLIYVGSSNEDVSQAIVDALMCRSESELGEPLTRLIALGHGLLYLGKKVQELLSHCAEHLDNGETHQGPAVLGIAMVAMAEELGLEMSIRSLEHLLQYGELNIRRAVPLALGLLCISNPKVNVVDILSRLSHDIDIEVVMAAIISMGLIGAGTNNARIVFMLRNLSSFYYRTDCLLFCVQIAQGLVHLGKGLLTLDPYHWDHFLLSPKALAGLVIVLHACLDMKAIILGKYHFVLYFLVLAMRPRMLTTVDENFEPLSVPVRVGRAVDVVGKAGQPKTITCFQNHRTPVLLEAGKRAELATEKYIPLTPILEGHVILMENPEYKGDN
ncbi:hypothetical protein GQ457_17G023840 [Hibiscus cannabinus]